MPLRVKICGITDPAQGRAIAQLGADWLGFICVPRSPRYVTPNQIAAIAQHLPAETQRIGVFVDTPLTDILTIVQQANLTGIQLHGTESPDLCDQLREACPSLTLIKAFRLKHPDHLGQTHAFVDHVDALLLDAYHPTQHGGTGLTLDWTALQRFDPPVPWFLAGGLRPDNVLQAIALAQPDGIDLSSGVETAPGQKDLQKVQHLFTQIQPLR